MNTLWIFRPWRRHLLKQNQSLPYKMKMETDLLRSQCIDEIQEDTKKQFLSLRKLVLKLGIKEVQKTRTSVHRNEFTVETRCTNPLFTQNQIALTVFNYIKLLFVLGAFLSSETYLTYIICPLFLPGGSPFMHMSVSVAISLLILFGIDYSLESHFNYRIVKEKRDKMDFLIEQLKIYRDKAILGAIILILCIGIILAAGIARIYFLENINPEGLTPERLKSVQRASSTASIVTLLVTICTGCYMGVIKRDHAKLGIAFRVFLYWRRMHKRRNSYSCKLTEAAHKILFTIDSKIIKHWMLVAELKRVYKMDTEHDAKFNALHDEYESLKANEDFEITDTIYQKFSSVQCCDSELFRLGIHSSNEISKIRSYCYYCLNLPEQHISDQLETTSSPLGVNGHSYHTNGKATKPNYELF